MSVSNLVQLRMKDETVDQTTSLQEKYNSPSKSEVVRRAIGLNDTIVKAIESGHRIYIEGNGSRVELLIPGISKGKLA